MSPVYDLKEKVVKEIVKIDTAMERILYYLENDRLGVFKPWALKMFWACRRDIAMYGGLLCKEIRWEQEDYLNGTDLSIKVAEADLRLLRAKGVDIEQLLSALAPYEIVKEVKFKPVSIKKQIGEQYG